LQALAEAVRRQPGWRFELVLLRPEFGPPGTREWSAEDVTEALSQVGTLLGSGHQEAALLLAWSAAEAALRLLAHKEQLELEREDAPYLLKLLVSRAVLTRAQHDLLWDVLQSRNAVAHGLKPPELDTAKIVNLIKLVPRLIKGSSQRRARERERTARD
jgi:hypothetical protein